MSFSSNEWIESDDEEEIVKKLPCHMRVRRCLQKTLDHWVLNGFMALLTIYTLWADDIRILSVDMEYDFYFYSITCLAIALFGIEFILSIVSRSGYICTFYFWLDLLALLTLFPDVGWLYNPIARGF